MDFIATKLIGESIDKTKKLLFPFNFKNWIILAILSIFIGGGVGFNSRMNIPSNFDFLNFTSINWAIIIGVLILAFSVGLVFLFLGSVLHFCFLDSITKNRIMISKYFKKNIEKGKSLFLLKLSFSLVSLFVLLLINYPHIMILINNIDNLTFSLFSIPYLIISGIIYLILFSIISVFINTFTVYTMFIFNKKSLVSLKKVINVFKKEYKEMLLFLLFNLLIGIVVSMIMVTIFLLMGLIIAFIVLIFAIIGTLLYKLSEVLIIPLIVIAVILGVLLFIIFMILSLLISVPFSVFTQFYRLDVMKSILSKK